MRRPDSIQSRMRRMVVVSCGFMAAVLAVTLTLVLGYNSQYKNLLYNVTTASEFNQDFKENIDLKMYYYVIESRYSEGLPIQEVQDAQDLAKDLLSTTSQKDSLRAVTSVLDLCENLEEKIYQIEQTQSYDGRQMQLENNVYVLTALIQEYMYNYLYCESVQLNLLQQQISRQITAEILLVTVLAAFLILLLARYSVRLSRSVAQPVVDLSRRAEDVIGGDLTVREPVRSETYEIRTLSEGMEQMIARINAQIQEITQKQASLRKTELALLQAQINPHFLYNTMDTIIWLIEADRPQAAVEMVSNLSNFFRHSLSRGEDVITLGEEEQHVRSYLQIQRARYQDILDYTVELDPSLGETRLPKLTLQPLVENALYHGIKRKRGKGCISITSRRAGTDVLLEIADDGAGMTEERLAELRRAMETGERVGFGLVTVHERLRLLFGPPYGLTLSSREGEGTTVTVRLPCGERKEAESDWRVANSESMKAVFTEENGYRLLFEDARQKQENQISAIRKFIQQQVDYIVLMPISEDGWDSVLQEAREAGIPVILVDRMVNVEDEGLYAAHIGSDFLREGAQAAAWMERAFQEEDPVRIIHIQGTLGSTAQIGRTAALEEAVARHGNWELLAQLDGDFTQAKTYEVMTDYLSALPGRGDIDVVYCENDNIAFGALQSLEEQGCACGREGVNIITFDATRGALTECLSGNISLAVECNPLLGPLVEEAIQTMEAGGTPEKHRYVEEQLFTAEDLTEALIESREY